MTDKPAVDEVFDQLKKITEGTMDLSRIDQAHDALKLMGLVLGLSALLDVVTNPVAEAKDKVAAARALMNLKESPEAIAERLRRSSFVDLTVEELAAKVRKVKNGA